MGLLKIKGNLYMQVEASSSQDIDPIFDEKMIPEIIEGQFSKLNELDVQVKKAMADAQKAEDQAKQASARSASFWSFSDQKKAAIEALQAASQNLASAVQSGVQAQKISFDFQTRLVDVTKYLFKLGVSNIAANRFVVRELEMRLRGASENELSELARQEVMSVIEQLKEHEDLLHKQAMMRQALSRHADTIRLLQEQIDSQNSQIDSLNTLIVSTRSHAEKSMIYTRTLIEELREELKEQNNTHHLALTNINNHREEISNKQQQEIEYLRQQYGVQQSNYETLSAEIQVAHFNTENAAAILRSALNLRVSLLSVLTIIAPAIVYFLLR